MPRSSQASNQFLTRETNLASLSSPFFASSSCTSMEKNHFAIRILCLSRQSSSIDLGRTLLFLSDTLTKAALEQNL